MARGQGLFELVGWSGGPPPENVRIFALAYDFLHFQTEVSDVKGLTFTGEAKIAKPFVGSFFGIVFQAFSFANIPN